MGKKGKKKSYKKQVKSFASSNKVLLAALGGAATGITLATLLGSDKAKQIVDTIGNSVKDISAKVKGEITHNGHETVGQY